MPELPEVETIRRALEQVLPRKQITGIRVYYPRSFSGDPAAIIGKQITSIGRKGKILNIRLNSESYLNVHLKMSGQLLYASSRESAEFPVVVPLEPSSTGLSRMPSRVTRVEIEFADGALLFFNDQRKFGWIRHATVAEGTDAPDVTGPAFTQEYFAEICAGTSRDIKTVLLDQSKIAGVGNVYANDALFTAGIRPDRSADSLTGNEIRRLHRAVIETIQEGIARKGTSATSIYVTPDGSKGSYQLIFRVYSREGQPCHICGSPILRKKKGGRSNFWCPICQH
ncbi:MAG: bifunctional DNA-formamidopyrimidine glycosylase/DNA-(apurinic or apyrimidinic site) lyase [Patescibacteria group bacterium]|nr:bifunctional DNA-formamidopyrimidine glycosylase/DNA-(apurinic or apyrimidinic site) lyase [Patescibacteria group bacterium]